MCFHGPADRINVGVETDRITLEGDVDWRFQELPRIAVRNLKRVKGGRDRVVIRPTTISPAEAALRRRLGARKSHFTVETSDDHVTLWGAVRP